MVGLLCEFLLSMQVKVTQGHISVLYLPDFIAGTLAVSISEHFFKLLPTQVLELASHAGTSPVREGVFIETPYSLIPTYFTTLLEGILLSGFLFCIVLLVMVGAAILNLLRPKLRVE